MALLVSAHRDSITGLQSLGLRTRPRLWFALLSCLIFGLNLLVCWRLFRFDYIGHMGSIEGAYYAISRHMIESWPDLSWWPAWYDGIPFSYSYPPVLHSLVALCALVFHVSVARAHHIVTAFFYAFGPVTLFWLALRLCRSLPYSFFAALAYSLLSLSNFLVPSVLKDIGNPLLPRRLQTLIIYGDGPHIASLALVPLALLLFDYALASNRAFGYIAAALGFLLVTLTNWLGAVALALLLFSYLLARTAAGVPGGSFGPWWKALGVGALAYLFGAPLITPSLIRTIQFNAQTIGGDYRSSVATLLAAIPYLLGGLLVLKALCRQMKVAVHNQLFLFFTLLTGAICMGSEWFKVALVPQPERYALEMELGLVPLCIIPLTRRLDSLKASWKLACAAALLTLCILQVRLDRKFAKEMIRPQNAADTFEFTTANWFSRHIPGARVMTLGSGEFFLNAFSDSPQHGGGFEQANPSWENRVAQYIVSSADATGDRDAEITLCWLKAFGIRAVSVGGPHSHDAYPAFQRLDRFNRIGTLAWQQGDDYIYEIPLRNASLAHAMPAADLVKMPPINGIDVQEMQRYVRAIDDPTSADIDFQWTSQHSARLTARLRSTDVLATQISYFPGWKATSHGASLKTFKDALNFLIVEPHCSGDCVIDLVYDGGPEFKAGLWISFSALIGSLVWIVASRRRLLSA